MKRRTVLGLGLTAISGTLAVGSGAFGLTRANRRIDVEVENDSRAYLVLDPLQSENSEGEILSRSRSPGNQIRFAIPGSDEARHNRVLGDGPGSDSEYYFDRLVRIENRGTKRVAVHSESEGKLATIAIYDSDDGQRTPLKNEGPVIELEPNEAFEAGVYLDTTGVTPGTEVEDSLGIVAQSIE